MIRIPLALAATLAAAVLASSASAAAPRLLGSTGPDGAFHITLTKGGKKVTKLKAGIQRCNASLTFRNRPS